MSSLGQTGRLIGRGAQGQSVYSSEYQGVPYTIDDMRRMVRNSITREQTPELRRLAESIIAGLNPKDYISEIAALYYYVLVHVRYTRDPVHIEYVQHPMVVLQPELWDRQAGRRGRQDDCEAIATTLAALCMVIGNQCEFVTISMVPGQGFHHVYVVVKTPNGQRIVLDPVPGPYTSEMLSRISDYKIWPIEPVRFEGQAGWTVAGMGPVAGLGAPANWAKVTVTTNPWTVTSNPPFRVFGVRPQPPPPQPQITASGCAAKGGKLVETGCSGSGASRQCNYNCVTPSQTRNGTMYTVEPVEGMWGQG